MAVTSPPRGRARPFADEVQRDTGRRRLDLRMTPEMRAQLRDLCDAQGVNASEVIRRAVSDAHRRLVEGRVP